jgi:hypothetical protein
MSKFQDLFKRKPGGTTVGNLLRAGSKIGLNAIAPGAGALVGNGAMMITDSDAQGRDNGSITDAQVAKTMGKQMNEAYGAGIGAAAMVTQENNVGGFTTNSKKAGIQAYFQNNWKMLAGIGAGFIGLYLIYKKMYKKGRR